MKTEEELWQEMAAMTLAKCRQTCHSLGSCCETAYCEIAEQQAKQAGVVLERTGNAVPFLDDDGKCVVPPHLRQMCSLHQCKINGIGFDPKDPKWTKRYFQVRRKLEKFGWDEATGM